MKYYKLLAIILIPLLVSACGVKGNLKLPDQQKKKTEKTHDGSL